VRDDSQGTQTWIDRIATPFDRAWQAGEHPRIEDYLAGVVEPRRSQLLQELLRVELGNRRAAGEAPRPEEYVIRFPQNEAMIRAVFTGGADRSVHLSPADAATPSQSPREDDEGSDADWPPASSGPDGATRSYKPEASDADPDAILSYSVAREDGKVVVAEALSASTSTSAASDIHTLRRHRLAATASLLVVSYAIFLIWHVSSRAGHGWVGWLLISARFILSAVVAAWLFRPISLSPVWLRALEVALFGGLTLIVALSQYLVNLAMLQAGDPIGMIAFMKNGVLQMVVLMLLYGTFVPNPPRTVAWVVAAMAVAPLLGIALLSGRPEFALVAERFQSADQTGSDALFLLMGAGMAIFGSRLLSGLRTELHHARKYGQYRLVRKLGEGGMGEVYLAEHQLLKRPCAIKLILPEHSQEPGLLRRFEREVRATSHLTHPNIVEVYDFGLTPDGAFYYVMEYLPGLTLRELVSSRGTLPLGRVIYLVRQVCEALREAHLAGLVHRDVKPGNVIVGRYGSRSDVVKLLDFGLVRSLADAHETHLTGEGQLLGTPDYMSPEQAGGAAGAGPSSDLYSVGALTYYLLTGRPPFVRSTVAEAIVAHLHEAPQPPLTYRPDVPRDLEAVVLRCLAKTPPDRFPTIKALGDALADCNAAGEWGPNHAEAWWEAVGIGEPGRGTHNPASIR
jgi:serine/threonine-protein kinase